MDSVSKENVKIAKDFSDMVKDNVGVKLVAVFGSSVTGKATEDSDIDILVIRDQSCLGGYSPCPIQVELMGNKRYAKIIVGDNIDTLCDYKDQEARARRCIREDRFLELLEPGADLTHKIVGGKKTLEHVLREAVSLYENPPGYLEELKKNL